MELLWKSLGSPGQQIPTIHIAGTKGKGSTAWYAGSLLRATGLKVGVYTSPHLVSVCERISINGAPISESAFAQHVDRAISAAEVIYEDQKVKATWFELLTVMALNYFYEEKVHAIVLETGLGGRLDSTNVCDPKVTVITRIGLDHTSILGETLSAIAMEKGGIIKHSVPLMTVSQDEEAMAVLRKLAEINQAPLKVLGEDFSLSVEEGGMDMDTGSSYYTRLSKSALGIHQWENAALAIMAVEELSRIMEFRFTEDDVRFALKNTEIPGRAQRWKDLLLDGAHNTLSMRALVDVLRSGGYGEMRVILGMCRDKDYASAVKLLKPWVNEIWCVGVPSERSLNPQELCQTVKENMPGVTAHVCDNVSEALEMARGLSDEEPILVTGSFYLVGEALKVSFDEKMDLAV